MHPAISMIVTTASQDVNATFRRLRRNVVVYAIAAFLALTAYFIVIAGLINVFLTQPEGTLIGALIIAAGFVGLAIVAVVTLKILNRRDRLRSQKRRERRVLAASAAITLLPRLLGTKATLATLAVGGLAYVAMRQASGAPDSDE